MVIKDTNKRDVMLNFTISAIYSNPIGISNVQINARIPKNKATTTIKGSTYLRKSKI